MTKQQPDASVPGPISEAFQERAAKHENGSVAIEVNAARKSATP